MDISLGLDKLCQHNFENNSRPVARIFRRGVTYKMGLVVGPCGRNAAAGGGCGRGGSPLPARSAEARKVYRF